MGGFLLGGIWANEAIAIDLYNAYLLTFDRILFSRIGNGNGIRYLIPLPRRLLNILDIIVKIATW